MGILLNKAKNCIINGAMDFWQRNTSFAAVADNTYTADRFVYRKTGTMVHTVSRDTDVPTAAQADFTFPFSMRLNLTTAQTSLSAADYIHITQRVEGNISAPLIGNTFTISFWVKATLAGTYAVAIRNNANDRSYVSTYTINATNTWERKSISVPFDSAGTWLTDTGIGMRVVFSIASGSNRRASVLNTWLAGEFDSHSSCVNGVTTGATDFRITGIQLEEGVSASNFERAGGLISNEFVLCQRYHERFSSVVMAGFNNGSITIPFKATKRVSPTPTVSLVTGSNLTAGSPYSIYNGLDLMTIRADVPSSGIYVATFNVISDAEL